MDRILLRPDEAAAAIGVSRAKLYALLAARAIPSVKIGGSIRIPIEQLKLWIAERTAEQSRREVIGV